MKKIMVCSIALLAIQHMATAQAKKATTKPATTKPAGTAAGKPVMKTLLDSFSYAAGVNIANNMKDQGISKLNSALMVRAIDDVLNNATPAMTAEQCNNTLQEQMGIFGRMKEAEAKKSNAAEKAKGEAYLAQNKTRKEVTTLPNGLQYEILTPGEANGLKPSAQDTVVVDYVGTLTNGTQFDASTGRGPATFPVGGVIKGWTEILQMMTKGAKWKVYIPSELAYGDRGAGAQIPGGAALIFEISLLDIKPAAVK